MPSTDTDQSSQSTSNGNGQTVLNYEETLMYGKYKNTLGAFAKEAALKLRAQSLLVKQEKTPLHEPTSPTKTTKCKAAYLRFKEWFLYHLGGDYIFLLFLGISMALLSFAMDYSIHACQKAHYYLYRELKGYVFLQYLTWVGFPLIFITFSVGFVHIVSPQAVGSGIPEMKTIMRGVVLKEYLTLRVLVAKMVGLVASLGSRLPIGKEGPFVHIASIVATLLNDIFAMCKARSKTAGYRNEMLAAACAVGVACNFAAPIGGVLFSIEVTATYFAVRDYWRGFFGAVCGAFMFRLLAVWHNEEETITALFKTNFRLQFPYDLQEFIGFTAIGIICGFAGALFVYIHRLIVNFHRDHDFIKSCLSRSRFIYPALVSIIISSITFPGGLGQFMAGELTLKEAVDTLFDNKTWNKLGYIDESDVLTDIQEGWQHPTVNIYITLMIFIVLHFAMTAFAITLPVPAGVFMPVFVIGAAFGRLVGETMSALYPQGFVGMGGQVFRIVPGGYAVVGAASLSGAVTHTVSTAVIVFELTGQISHILPVMIAVIISNLIAQRLQLSIYDSIIEIKELPYLPDIIRGKRKLKKILVEDFMLRNVKFLTLTSTYRDVKSTLALCSAKSLPIVKSADDMVLIGSIPRHSLQLALTERMTDWPTSSSHSPTKSAIKEETNVALKEVLTDAGSSSGKNGAITMHSAEADLKDVSPVVVLEKPGTSGSKILENEILDSIVDFQECKLDPAPFQIVEKTSIHMVHSMFSLLGVTRAYVTSIGRLVGLVTINELRTAIEAVSSKRKKKQKEKKKVIHKAKYGTRSEQLTFFALQQEDSEETEHDDY
uniref:chloride channel protein 2-like n=1 Tax=Styela clava TaxID=7725 RepID=UPI001939CB9C|nr:chloride channel protein 2-like [Styela clava]